MNEDRKLTIYFNNGTQMKVSFPVQIKNSTAAVLESMKRMGESDKLAIEAEGRLIVIPWSSVQYIELTRCRPPCLMVPSRPRESFNDVQQRTQENQSAAPAKQRAWPNRKEHQYEMEDREHDQARRHRGGIVYRFKRAAPG